MLSQRAASSLAAVEEASGEEDDGNHESQACVKDVVEAEAEEAVRQPRCKAQEPYPRCLSHHAHAPDRGRGQLERARFAGLVLH
jgi:hypothetical protein